MGTTVFNNMQEGGNLGDSFVSAFQLQQLSRPLSRYADWIAGESVERTGAVVDPNAGFAFDLATLARATGARPLQEQVIRNTGWQNSYYNSQNSKDRKQTIAGLRQAMQSSDGLTLEGQQELFERYMTRRGTISGWRKAMNDAALNTVTGKVIDIPKNSALNITQRLYGYGN
jgi:ribosome modulation factor